MPDTNKPDTNEPETSKSERDARNRGLKVEDERLRDPERRPPHSEEETEASPSRSSTPPRDASDIAHLENPPQTEGPRERSNDAI
ncbi:hypothetical protein BH23GEM9_BH23GEM9_13090 [soil metagenome]